MRGCASSSKSSSDSRQHARRWSASVADRDVPAAPPPRGPAAELVRGAEHADRVDGAAEAHAPTKRSISFVTSPASPFRRSPSQWGSSPITSTGFYRASNRRDRSSETARGGWRPNVRAGPLSAEKAASAALSTAQIKSSCLTASRSSFNSFTVMSIREREKSSISSPSTIS